MTELKKGLSQKNYTQIINGIQKTLVALGDDGCNVLPFQKVLQTKVLPLSIYPFDNGWYVCDAKDNSLIGERIISMDGIGIDEVYRAITPLLNTDNIHYRDRLFAVYGLIPAMLRDSGIQGLDRSVELKFASGKSLTMTAESLEEYRLLDKGLPNDGIFSMTQKDHSNENYWMEYFPNTNTLFIQFQRIANSTSGPSFSKFVDLIEKEIESSRTKKIILDVRYGGGGNGFKLKSLTDLLRVNPQINRDGNLLVLTSRATNGTLLELASVLQLNTKAVFIGEPTGEGPNTVGDTKYITLPNSGIQISLTKKFWPTSWPMDLRKTLVPDVKVTYSFIDKEQEKDPWLDAALSYQGSNPGMIPSEKIRQDLSGIYNIGERRVKIEDKKEKLILMMERGMKSFFEIHTELYNDSTGVLNTDINGVKLYFKESLNGTAQPDFLNWMGTILPFEK
jgi:hypothetical protein